MGTRRRSAAGLAVAGFVLVLSGPAGSTVVAQTVVDGETVDTFFNAIAGNDTNAASAMLEANTNLARSIYGDLSKRPLHEAVRAGNLSLARRLVELGADLNAPGDTYGSANSQSTPLHVAIQFNQPTICKWLLEAGANPDLMDFSFSTPLHRAFGWRRQEMAGWLLDYGADPFQEKRFVNDHTTPFELAILYGGGRLVPRMLGQAQPDATALKPNRPLPWKKSVAENGQAIARLLTDRGVTLLSEAVQRGESEAVAALLTAGVPATQTNGTNRPVLQIYALAEAAAQTSEESAHHPVEYDHGGILFAVPAAEPSRFDPERWQRIRELLERAGAEYDAFAATALGDVAGAERLRSKDPMVVRARDIEGDTPLHWAVRIDRLPLTSYWLQAGVSSAATNFAGQTAAHLAAALGLTNHLARLLAAGAPTSVRDTNGWTPLDAAARAHKPATIRLLLGANSGDAASGRGISTPLHEAIVSGNLGALAAVSGTTSVNAPDESGFTPLQLAVQRGHLGAAALLLDKGANVNARDRDGNTALHLVLRDSPPMIIDRPSAGWLEHLRGDPKREAFLPYLSSRNDGQNEALPAVQTAAFLLACGVDAKATNGAGKSAIQLVLETSGLSFQDERVQLLKLLQIGGAKIDEADANGDTTLHRAAHGYDQDAIEQLVAAGANVNATNKQGRTPLHAAIQPDHIWMNCLNALITARADVNAQDNDGLTPLHLVALSEGYPQDEAVGALLKAGANPNLRDKRGRVPLHLFAEYGASYGAVRCIPVLVEAGTDLSVVDNQGRTFLHYLAASGGSSVLFYLGDSAKFITSTNVDVFARDHDGNTPLHLVARAGTSDVFDWLVKRGAGLDATNNAGETPRLLAMHTTNEFAGFRFRAQADIFQAVRQGDLDSVAALLKTEPGLLETTNQAGQTPLRVAVVAHRTNVVDFLAQRGARWDVASAVIAGRHEILKGLLARDPGELGAKVGSETLLHLAAANGCVSCAEVLLRAGTDLRVQDSAGLSPLGTARLNGQKEMADFLVKLGAEKNIFDAVYVGDLDAAAALLKKDKSLALASNQNSAPAVSIAVGRGHAAVLELLLDRGASVSGPLFSGRTPLHIAAIYNRSNTAAVLLRRGAEVDAADTHGLTPLQLAARLDSAEVAEVLLQYKANPDLKGPSLVDDPYGPMGAVVLAPGNTALHVAAFYAQTNLIALLLKAGASVNATNSIGLTPLDLTRLHEPGGIPSYHFLSDPTINSLLGFDDNHLTNRLAQLRTVVVRQRAAAELLERAGGIRGTLDQAGVMRLSFP